MTRRNLFLLRAAVVAMVEPFVVDGRLVGSRLATLPADERADLVREVT